MNSRRILAPASALLALGLALPALAAPPPVKPVVAAPPPPAKTVAAPAPAKPAATPAPAPAPAAAQRTFPVIKPPVVVSGGMGTTQRALEDENKAKTRCPSLAKLDHDTATLDGHVVSLSERLATVSRRSEQLARLLAVPGELAKVLAGIEKLLLPVQAGAKAAAIIPSLEKNAERVEHAVTPALQEVKAAHAKAAALAAKLAPVLKGANLVATYSGRTATGLKVLHQQVLVKEPDASYGAQYAILHYDEPVRACIQRKVDDTAARMDTVLLDLDRVVTLLLVDYSVNAPGLAALEQFALKLEALEKALKAAEALEKRLEAMDKALKEITDLLEPDFTMKFPFPFAHFKIDIKMKKIVKGVGIIEDTIKEKLSGAIWDAAKTIGVGKLARMIFDEATKDLDKAMDKLHLNPDLTVPGLDQLDELLRLADPLAALFPGSLGLGAFDLNAPDFGLPHALPGVNFPSLGSLERQLSPFPFDIDWAKFKLKVPDFGCR